jgi:hypothetical protein
MRAKPNNPIADHATRHLPWLLALLTLTVCLRDPARDEPKRDTSAQAALHFAGDVYFGEAYHSRLDDEDGAARYRVPLARLRPWLESAPVVANLETALTEPRAPGFEAPKQLMHWANPAANARSLADHGFVALSSANNHSMDYGLTALLDTHAALRRQGVASFGSGATLGAARAPWLWTLRPGSASVPLAVIGAYWYRPRYDAQYRFYADRSGAGVRELVPADIARQIAELRRREPNRAVVVFPHWGSNYHWRSKQQRELAHAIVDAGADLVVGHGAHVFQEVERYRGRWILYGLGNLAFLTPGRYPDHDIHRYGMLATLRWTATPQRLAGELLLRFVASDNKQTDYQPHILSDADFEAAHALLRAHSCSDDDTFCRAARVDSDALGPHLRLPIARWPIAAWADAALSR